MKTILFLIALLVPALASADPQMQFKERDHDFGTIEQGARLEHVFEFENTGDAALEIWQITPS